MHKGCRAPWLWLWLCLPWLQPVQAAPAGQAMVVLNADSMAASSCFGFHHALCPSSDLHGAVLEIGAQGNAADTSYSEHVSYRVRIPRDDTYYLWARASWGFSCSDPLTIQFAGRTEVYHLAKDSPFNKMHWVCLCGTGGHSGKDPIALPLRQGSVIMTITGGARDYHTCIDEFLLTTERTAHPLGIYRDTPHVLAAGSPDHGARCTAAQPVQLVFKAAAGALSGPCGMVQRYFIDLNNKLDGNKVLRFHYPQSVCFDARQGFRHGILGVASCQCRLPHGANYYLWARVCWARAGENELCCTLVKRPNAGSNGGCVDGSFSDQQYGVLHWVRCTVSADPQHASAIPLPGGDLQLTLFAYQYHVKIAQLLLTTDPTLTPHGAYAQDGSTGLAVSSKQ